MNNFDQANRSRYAQMQSSLFNKSSSSIQSSPGSKMNLLGKFSHLQELTFNIEAQTRALTASARESARVIDQMKRVVAEKELNQYKQKSFEQVKKYERVVSYGAAENERRSQQLQSKCKSLMNSTEDLRHTITSLHNRINKLQNVLGFYNGAEIVSNY